MLGPKFWRYKAKLPPGTENLQGTSLVPFKFKSLAQTAYFGSSPTYGVPH